MLLGVDVGGTFTDAVLVLEETSQDEPSIYTAKVPSTPREQARGVLAAVRMVLERAERKPGEVERFAHGMTVATNALLEGRGARTALVATEGFTDIVELARQARPHLYRLCLAAPAPLSPAQLRFAAPERMTPDGPLRALQPQAAQALVEAIAQAAPEAIAVVLLHSYAHPEHERLLGAMLSERLPSAHISLSHELVGTFREYERAATTEIDAALSPLLSAYLRRLCADAEQLGLVRPVVMQSSGGLSDASSAAAHAALTVLSGPAGGVAGAQLLAELADERDVLCFDMGGTSCDVCLIEDGQVAETAASVIAGRPLALPTLDIHTVGAGGGSIAWRDPGGALRVGPRSAGADPGPACYGRGGTLPTVTDANLVLGRLPIAGGALAGDSPSERSTAGLTGGIELDREAAKHALSTLAAELDMEILRCAEGIVRVAEAEMLSALRVMSVERGLDPRGFALLAFGGAGPLHAAALAGALGIERILIPHAAGVLCALGLASAAPRRDAARTVMLSGEHLCPERLSEARAALVERVRQELEAKCQRVAVSYELRYRGQSFELQVDEQSVPGAITGSPSPAELCEAFACTHELRYGYREAQGEVELVTIRACAWGSAPAPKALARQFAGREHPQRAERSAMHPLRQLVLDGCELQADYLHGELPVGTQLHGPAICSLPESTLLVPPGWHGIVDVYGTVRLQRTHQEPPEAQRSSSS